MALLNEPVRIILLDIEGTTTALDFVHKILFPYARAHARQFLSQHVSSPEVRADIEGLRDEHRIDTHQGLSPPFWHHDTPEEEMESLAAYVEWLIERDRKSTPLKSLEGKIWEEGYREGRLHGHVFDDVPRALKRWRDGEKNTCTFSSGSALAQKLLFANSIAGDLTRYISGHFDTTIGSKTEERSYQEIADALRRLPGEIVFISDVTPELDAARSAGLQTLLCVRPGNRPQAEITHRVIRSLDEVYSAV